MPRMAKPLSPPVVVSIPSTKAEKMEAIVNLSRAVCELSKALNSTHVVVNLSNMEINNAETGVKITGGE